jgi:AraC-like DNA-binding protein
VEKLSAMKTRSFRGDVKLKSLLDDVFSLYFSDHDFKKILIRNRITDFLAALIELERAGKEDILSQPIKNCLDYITLHLHENISLENLAELSHLSLSRFKKRFKVETGVPPGDYILRRKIEQAVLLLKESDKSITDIAFDLGFSSSQYFATVFKRYQSFSPSTHRNRL